MSTPVVFAYARKSPYKEGGKGSTLGVDNQHEAIAEYVRRAIDPDAVIVPFTDEKMSAYLDKPRPQWEDMLRRIREGEASHVVGWHTDRMCRRVEATGKLWSLVESSGVQLHTTFAGHVTDPMGLYFESIMAENESRQRSRRLRLKHDGLGKAGDFSGGQRRYGYAPRMTEVIPAEAEVIREAVSRVLNGDALNAIASSLNDRGIATARGGNARWHATSIRAVMMSPHIAGLRNHKGNEVTATWPAIVEPSTWRAVVRKLSDPDRFSGATPGRVYLLSGLATCGGCGGKVRATAVKSEGWAVYRCKCFQRQQGPVNELVREYVVARLEQIDGAGALVSSDNSREAANLTAERDGLAGRRDEVAGLMATGAMTPTAYAAAEKALADREAVINARLAALADEAAAPQRALDGATGPNAGRVWDGWTNDTTGEGLARQRAIIALLLNVTIHPTGRNRYVPASESVRVTYRELG